MAPVVVVSSHRRCANLMSSDYGYINARLRAMRSFLLKKKDYEEGISQKDITSLSSFIMNLSGYGNEFRNFSGDYSGINALGEVFKRNLCNTFKKIINFSSGQPREYISVLLRQWDVYNLKVVLRALSYGKSQISLKEALVPAGELAEEDYLALSRAGNMEAMALELRRYGNFYGKLSKLILSHKEDRLDEWEDKIDLLYFDTSIDGLSRMGDENAKILFNFLKWEKEILSKTNTDRDNQFRIEKFKMAHKIYGKDPLSIGIAIGYVAFKEIEVQNLRFISQAIRYGIPMDMAWGELIV